MAKPRAPIFEVLGANLQISFYYRLEAIRQQYLHQALRRTVEKLDIHVLDGQLAQYVSPKHLSRVASHGLRGEVFFPVPCTIQANPFLLGYYRLLFGLSQKAFYGKGPFGRFKRLEERGDIPDALQAQIEALCASLVKTAQSLVDGIDELSLSVVHELQLLTVGPQLRGSENTRLGQEAMKRMFRLVSTVVGSYAREATERTIRIENDSGRTVLVEFFSDPDIRVTQKLESGVRPLVSMEVKGGTDVSNIHNRLGEAEKSHQKARKLGFFEFWTVIRCDVDHELAKRESPTTTHFFQLDRIAARGTPEHAQFRELLGSLIGIRPTEAT